MTQRFLDMLRGKSDFTSNQFGHDARLAATKFDLDEIHVLRKTWQDLADRSNGKGVDKETFLQYFPLNGLLGERLFAQFDRNSSGFIDFDEFIVGLAKVCRGTIDDKIHFLFDMYNVSHDTTISKQELSTLLNHIPKEAFYQDHLDQMQTATLSHGGNGVSRTLSVNGVTPGSGLDSGTESDTTSNQDPNEVETPHDGQGSAVSNVGDHDDLDFYTNHDMVERAFEECDLNHEGRLTYEEFKMWLQRTPSIMDYIESILPYNGPKDIKQHMTKAEALPHIRRISSKAALGRSSSISDVAGDIFNHSTHQGRNSSRMSSKNRNMSIGSLNHQCSTSTLTSNGGESMSPQVSISRNSSFDKNSVQMNMNGAGQNSSMLSNSFNGIATRGLTRTPSITGGESNVDNEDHVRMLLTQAMEVTQNEAVRGSIGQLLETHYPGNSVMNTGTIQNDFADSSEIYRTVVTLEDYLWKKGKAFHMMFKRYYLLSGNCMYYYTSKSDVRPKGVIFITGSIIERLKDYDMELKGYYGFELLHQDLCTGEHHRHEKRVMYCRSEEQRDSWVVHLQHAAHVVPIEDDYVIGRELGRGRFSVVCECVHKVTGLHCAVKIIDKTTIEPEEKGLLRTEIAVLKLVNHPNIIHMEGLYESKTFIYIVMEMLTGGELFERIVGRPRFTEEEAAKLIRPLLESVAYLHDLGIVHRDLKPENILCGEELEDLKLADFGLSKMTLPKEKMDAACGTLSYVAPEVLTMQGYGKEADLWSVGVIMFLLLCGKLPFDGDDHNEIIRSTIQADLKVNPGVWARLSDDAKGLMTSLLNKSPKDRITAREALKHPFITCHAPYRRHSTSYVQPQPPTTSTLEAHNQLMSVSDSSIGSATVQNTTPFASALPSTSNSAQPSPHVRNLNGLSAVNHQTAFDSETTSSESSPRTKPPHV